MSTRSGETGSRTTKKKTWLETHARHVRVCNNDDPVCCAPWIFGQSVSVVLSPAVRIVARLGNYVHVGPALCLAEGGGSEWGVLPDLVDRTEIVRFASLGDWFWSFVGDTVTPHNTSAYIRRLTAYRDSLPIVPREQPVVPEPRVPYEPLPLPGRESEFVNQQANEVRQQMISRPTGGVVVQQPVQGNMNSNTAVGTFFPTDIYVVRRQGPRVFGIMQNGCLHSVYASKRIARRECRRLNATRPRNPLA